jgi:hypothetical protein
MAGRIMQYHDYIAQENARRERAQQLAAKYNQEPIAPKTPNLWMHTGIDRSEKPNELLYLGVTVIVLGLIFFSVGLYLAG